MKFLLLCHGKNHEPLESAGFTLNDIINGNVKTVDKNYIADPDFTYDLKSELFDDDYKIIGRYDVIYPVYCPYKLYVDDKNYYTYNSFYNISRLLNRNGIFYYRLHFSYLSNKKIKSNRETIINAVEVLKSFLKDNNIRLKVLSKNITEKYISNNKLDNDIFKDLYHDINNKHTYTYEEDIKENMENFSPATIGILLRSNN